MSKRKGPFICEDCKQGVSHPNDRWMLRREFVREDAMQRLGVITVRELCRKCVMLRIDKSDPNQSAFWPVEGLD